MLEKCVRYYNEYQIQLLKAKVGSICTDRVLKLADCDKKEVFMILKNHKHDDYPYCVIRGQHKTINSTLTKLKLTKDDHIVYIECCYANNLYNKVKEKLKGFIMYQRKYLYIDEAGFVLECSHDPDMMINEYSHVSITRNIGIRDITQEDFITAVYAIDNGRYEY